MFKRIPFTVLMLAFLAVCGCVTEKAPLTRTENGSGGLLLGSGGGFGMLGWDTIVTIGPTQTKAVQYFIVGDVIYGWGEDLEWRQDVILFSNGIAPSRNNPVNAYFVRYLFRGEERILTVTRDTRFRMADGSFKAVQSLAPNDVPQGADGNGATLLSVMQGTWIGGIQQISTEYGPSSTGILMDCNGLLIPDYAYIVSHDL